MAMKRAITGFFNPSATSVLLMPFIRRREIDGEELRGVFALILWLTKHVSPYFVFSLVPQHISMAIPVSSR
jgi:hypothetical protein